MESFYPPILNNFPNNNFSRSSCFRTTRGPGKKWCINSQGNILRAGKREVAHKKESPAGNYSAELVVSCEEIVAPDSILRCGRRLGRPA
jgi:hypothetical protein